MGAGPLRLMRDPALEAQLRGAGWEVKSETIEAPDPGQPELVRIVEGDRRLSRRVQAAVGGGAFPLVFAGNCNSCLGTVAGLDRAGGALGVVWFDAHADFDTPDRSLGFFDGMGLAILTGNGWELLRSSIPGFAPVQESDVVLVGVRDLEAHQRVPLAESALRRLPGASFTPDDLAEALADLRTRAARVYLHIDLDVLDPSEGRAERVRRRRRAEPGPGRMGDRTRVRGVRCRCRRDHGLRPDPGRRRADGPGGAEARGSRGRGRRGPTAQLIPVRPSSRRLKGAATCEFGGGEGLRG